MHDCIMKTITNLNQLNHEHHLTARYLREMCLLSACLLLAWTGVKQAANFHSVQNHAAMSIVGKNAAYDLAHDANYRAMVLLYTTHNGMRDFPF
jgi:uncharacterized membrane protein